MKKILEAIIMLVMVVTAVSASPGMDNPSLLEDDPLNPAVPLHKWRTLGNGQLNGYQYNSEGNLLYVIHGVPAVAESAIELPNGHHKFLIKQESVPKSAQYNTGYVHFHPASEQNPLQDGIEGYFLKHTAVTSGFDFPPGRTVGHQGIDFGFPNNYEII